MLARENFDGRHMWHNKRTLPQDSRARLVGRARVRGPKFEVFGTTNPERLTSDRAVLACLARHTSRSVAHGKRRVSARLGGAGEKSDFFSILLGTGRRRQLHFDARIVLIDVFVEVGFDNAVVVDAESLTEGILRDLEPAIDVSS